jgi:ComF family protein
MSVLDTLLGILAPYDCLGCRTEGTLLCPVCQLKLPSAPPFEHRLHNLWAIRSVTPYEDVAKSLVWKLKSNGARAAALIMAAHMTKFIENTDYLLVPVPTATARVRQRSYDQAKLLAGALSRRTGLRYIDGLRRLGQTHQIGAVRHQRLKQLSGSFYIKKPRQLAGAKIILIDDVVTTGATLETAAALLLKAGAAEVQAVTFAQTL